MGVQRKSAASGMHARRRWVLAMHLWLASIRDVDWVAASFGHA